MPVSDLHDFWTPDGFTLSVRTGRGGREVEYLKDRQAERVVEIFRRGNRDGDISEGLTYECLDKLVIRVANRQGLAC
jgi:hypothetical protein